MLEALKSKFIKLDTTKPVKKSKFIKLDTTKPVKIRLLSIDEPPKGFEENDKGQKLYILRVFNLDTQQEETKWVHSQHTIFVGLAALEADENDEFLITPTKVKGKSGNFTKYIVEKIN